MRRARDRLGRSEEAERGLASVRVQVELLAVGGAQLHPGGVQRRGRRGGLVVDHPRDAAGLGAERLRIRSFGQRGSSCLSLPVGPEWRGRS